MRDGHLKRATPNIINMSILKLNNCNDILTLNKFLILIDIR